MSPYVALDLETPVKAVSEIDSRMAKMLFDYHDGAECGTLNARAVEFVAKPGREKHLRNCVRREVTEILKQQNGFAGIFVLTSHKEPRLVQALTFWDSAKQAAENCWEESRAVRKLLSSLIDVRGKVHSYEAELPESPETIMQTPCVRTC
jgi:heme-degrading monooxygenase HmoA